MDKQPKNSGEKPREVNKCGQESALGVCCDGHDTHGINAESPYKRMGGMILVSKLKD